MKTKKMRKDERDFLKFFFFIIFIILPLAFGSAFFGVPFTIGYVISWLVLEWVLG